MREQGQKQSRNVEVIPYLDPSKNPSTQANYTGGNPYLDTSEDPSTQSNYAGGSPYLNTSED
ncbi:hypothetical protein [Neobacillus drentensis]|uniref:hypothetical protein n=1 Tax=Neobacillus drentensis TaxID=220684 RepID=UPI000825478F|nr:hypothetical protein [Neobacillus drentensis]